MAFDISVDEASPPTQQPIDSFEDFYIANVDLLGAALSLACDDPEIADSAITAALTRSSQRWNYLESHLNPVGWAMHAGLEQAEKTRRSTATTGTKQAAGGYARGLTLDLAVAALPLQQRSTLVTGYYLNWSDDFTAAGFETLVSTVRTRRERAISFIGHHLRLDEVQIAPLLHTHFRSLSHLQQPDPPDMLAVRRRGRRRTVGFRLAAALALAALIAAGGALFQTSGHVQIASEPDVVEGPSTSPKWFGPVSNGQGAFIALNTSGASRFVGSQDGAEWIDVTTWNSRAIDLRADVSSFERTGGRYVAVVETPSRFGTYVPPFIGTSVDLRDWNVRQIEIDPPEIIEGLFSRYDVVASAASGAHVLVALEGTDEIDYRSFGITSDDVCVESAAPSRREYVLCDGETITVTTPEGDRFTGTRYFRATGNGPFVEVRPPAEAVARSLVGFTAGFAVVDAEVGQILVSVDGEQWERATTAAAANRFLLIEGSANDDTGTGALVVEPDTAGWRSQLVSAAGLGAAGVLPLKIDPAAVWSRPDLAAGPAGWALFVTTSRPWERIERTAGWAVVSGEWVVSRQPDTDTITARSTRTSTTMRFAVTSEWVTEDTDGTIALRDPQTASVLVEVTQQDIDRARPADVNEAQVKAQVFFSPDGVAWRSVWSSTSDAWSGSVAVGDKELLLSGTQLTGGPITIPLDG